MATPAFHDFVVPLTVIILVVLFAFQSRGTAKCRGAVRPDHVDLVRRDRAFRACIWIAADPGVLWALNPLLWRRIFSSITGSSACSRWAPCSSPSPAPKRCTPTSAISAACRSRLAWFCLVLPALAMNYLGQGALVFAHPGSGR